MDTFLLLMALLLGALLMRWLWQLRREPLPGTLGALFGRQGVDWGALARAASVSEFTDGLGRCVACPAKRECGEWLASGRREGFQKFCPNAGFVERVRERTAR